MDKTIKIHLGLQSYSFNSILQKVSRIIAQNRQKRVVLLHRSGKMCSCAALK